jgi:hypothetical protein
MPLRPLARAIALTLLAMPATAVAGGVGTPADSAWATVPVRLAPDTTRRRPRAVEYSDWYARRLTVHRIGSYAMLPLFAAEYALGDRLLDGGDVSSWVKPTHVGVAVATGALFTTNTVTGLWNLYDARHDPAGRTRRYLHAATMLAADAGFVYTGTIAERATRSLDGRRDHRNAALTSMGISGAGTLMMWLWKH